MKSHTGEFVTYSPSKSSGFRHALRRRAIARAWADVQEFFAQCTTASEPSNIELEVARPTEWDDDEVMWPLIHHALDHFGTPDTETLTGGTRFPSGEPFKGGRYTWKRSLEQLKSDIAYLVRGEPWPRTTIGPITLRFSQSFTWRESAALRSLSRAHPHAPIGGGNFSIWLQRNCFVQPDLAFPFVHDDPVFLDFLRELRPFLPFRMHNSHFRRVIPGKTPDSFTVRKLPFPVLLS